MRSSNSGSPASSDNELPDPPEVEIEDTASLFAAYEFFASSALIIKKILRQANADVAEANSDNARTLIHSFLGTVQRNDRAAIDKFISEHCDNPNAAKHLHTAASVAYHCGHDELAAYLQQLATDRDQVDLNGDVADIKKLMHCNASETALLLSGYKGEIPRELCDVTNLVKIMEDPVTLPTGYTVDKATLEKLIDKEKRLLRCPMTNETLPLSVCLTATNSLLQNCINLFIESPENFSQNLPALFICPFSNKPITDPVTLSCGLTFDKQPVLDAFVDLFMEMDGKETITIAGHEINYEDVRYLKTDVSIKGLLNLCKPELESANRLKM